MEGGELSVPENGFEYDVALKKMKQFLETYAELYQRGMYHRDIKPQNILMTKDVMFTDETTFDQRKVFVKSL